MIRILSWLIGIALFAAGLAVTAWFLSGPPAPLPKGPLTVAPAVTSGPAALGSFRIILETGARPRLTITQDGRAYPIFQSSEGQRFVALSRVATQVHHGRGLFRIDDKRRLAACTRQHIADMTVNVQILTISGHLDCPDGPAPYVLTFSADGTSRLDFSLETDGQENADHEIRLHLIGASDKDEAFFGFGAQFTHTDMKGKRVPILVSEQGIGRGLQPITFFADLLYDGAGGDWSTTYAPSPHFISSRMWGLDLQTSNYTIFDLRRKDEVIVTAASGRLKGAFLAGRTPLDLITAHTDRTGRMRPLPDWIGHGAVLGIQGGTQTVRTKIARAEAAGVPIAGVWLQDWVGQRVTSFGKQLWWSWTLDEDRYPGWDGMVAELSAKGIETLTYINPFLVDTEEAPGPRRNLFQEAKARDFLLKDASGEPVMVQITSFSAAMVDLSNREAWNWLKTVVKSEVIAAGAMGWMADFGEAVPFDVIADRVEGGAAFHNAYADLWAEFNREVIEENGLGREAIIFHRSGHAFAHAHAPLFWLGDQLPTWDRYDGLKSTVTGLMTSGVSGRALVHADIGGYTTIDSPIKNYHRSKELFMRWAEMSAFTPVFRTHEGNRPERNHQFDTDNETLDHFARMARLFACLAPYRAELNREIAAHGWPMVRLPFLHYPDDPVIRAITHESFMLGSDLFIAPVLDPGVSQIETYLPEGSWIHGWTGQSFSQGKHRIAAPMGEPPALVRADSRHAQALLACFEG